MKAVEAAASLKDDEPNVQPLRCETSGGQDPSTAETAEIFTVTPSPDCDVARPGVPGADSADGPGFSGDQLAAGE